MRNWVGLISILVLALVGSFFYFGQTSSPVEYTTVVEKEVVSSLRAMGTVIPAQTIEIKTDRAEVIEKVNVEEGEVVKQGSTLFKYDDSLVNLQLKQTRAQVRQKEAARQQAKAAVKQAEVGLELARLQRKKAAGEEFAPLREELNQVQLKLKQVRRELERLERLQAKGAVSEIEVDSQQHRLEVLESNQQLLRKRLEKATTDKEHQVDIAAVEVKRAQAQYEAAQKTYQQAAETLASARAAAEKTAAQLDRYSVQAPRRGVVLAREVEPGEYVQPGQPAVTLGSERLLIRISPDEQEIGVLEVGNSGYASPEAYPEQKFKVEVVRWAPKVNSERGTIDVYLKFLQSSPKIVPNMAISVVISEPTAESALFLAPDYIVNKEKQPYVYLYRSGRAVKKQVKIEARQTGKWQVTGLAPGDKVLAPADLEAGQQIEIVR